MDGALVGPWGRFPQLCLVASGMYCSLNQPWNEVCIVLLAESINQPWDEVCIVLPGESINQPWDEVWIRQNKVYTFFRFSKICNQGSQAVEPKWPNVNLNNFGPKPRRWRDFENRQHVHRSNLRWSFFELGEIWYLKKILRWFQKCTFALVAKFSLKIIAKTTKNRQFPQICIKNMFLTLNFFEAFCY
jgi:hypothetical protein